jgi:hypothetical protein
MAAINQKYTCKILYLRLYMRWQQDSNGYPKIVRVRLGLVVGLVRKASNIQGYWNFKMTAIYQKSLENISAHIHLWQQSCHHVYDESLISHESIRP